ncbi:MAG: aldo/keto reductase [Deltaproteobacteria bacterium]|nr:aldo/keto reductase [Deltaproteobacteria bacterium]
MQQVPLGSTGLTVSELGFGAIPIIHLTPDAAHRVLRRAHDRGITLYDTANAYADSEEKIGRAFEGIRHEVVLATKTLRRDAKGVEEHLGRSLRLLRTDHVDLYQLHQVAQESAWEAITAPGGALEAAVRAVERGQVRHLGVTSHSLPMAVKLVETDLFATIQFPFNFIEDGAKDRLHAAARERGMGILAMKPFAGGVIDDAGVAFRFLRQHPGVIPIPGFDTVERVDQVVSFYDRPNVCTDGDLRRMDDYRAELGKRFCRRCEYCQPCPNGVMITMAMGYPVVVARMGPAVARTFCGAAMESVPQCTECGECLPRCPYELPIPEMLRSHREAYLRDLAPPSMPAEG